MGAWGTGVYDNDDAADFAAEVADRGIAAVREALTAVADSSGYVEEPEGAMAVVAADIVAHLQADAPADVANEYVAEWIATDRPAPSPELVELALRAIHRVRGEDSELADLWAETDDHAEWAASVADIERRLTTR